MSIKSCLIVDDSRVVRKVTARILGEYGLEILEAEDGQQAYDLCVEHIPDVVFVDWNMPNLTGIEFLEKVRTTNSTCNIKIVFCTTQNDVSYIKQALDSGADEYIMKPFDGEIVTSKLIHLGVIEKQ